MLAGAALALAALIASALLAPVPARTSAPTATGVVTTAAKPPPGRSTTPRPRICDRVAGLRGRDNGPGSLRDPFRTIRRLVASLRPGSVGCLLGGNYEETVILGASGRPDRPVTLRPAPGVRARVRGSIWVKKSANWITITGLSVDGSTSRNAFAVLVQGDDVVLSRLEITNRKHHGARVDAICVLAGHGFETDPANVAENLTIARSRIHHCGDDAHEHAIYLESTRNAHVVDSHLFANPGYGVHMYPDAQGSLVEYNVIDGNSLSNKANLTFSGEGAGGEYSQPHGSDDNIVRYNLITNAVTRYNVESYFPPGSIKPLNNQVVYNCVWNAPWGNYGYTDGYEQANNKDVDPLYVDRANGNFTLQSGSPCAGWGPRPGG